MKWNSKLQWNHTRAASFQRIAEKNIIDCANKAALERENQLKFLQLVTTLDLKKIDFELVENKIFILIRK